MIITLDLSAPRKYSQQVINEIIFRLKMKEQIGGGYDKGSEKVVLSLALCSQLALGAKTGNIKQDFNFDNVGKYAQLYSIPILYSIYEILKAKDSLVQTVSFLKRNKKNTALERRNLNHGENQ